MITASFIGHRNHAFKIRELVKNFIKIKNIYHPYKKFKNSTNTLNDILSSDCVFIICPSKFHFKFLNFLHLNKFKGYIFCEKIPVTTIKQLNVLKKFKNSKTFFNYNLQFSYLKKYLLEKKLGKMIFLNIKECKPFIFSEDFKSNWRSEEKNIIITNVLIHYLDLLTHIFKDKVKNLSINKFKISKKTKLIENLNFNFNIKKIIFNIFISYSSILDREIEIFFTNGKICIKNDLVKIFRSKKIYKRYEQPKIIFKKKEKNLFSDSNQRSVKFFQNIVKQRKKFSKKRLFENLLSNKMVLDICKKN